MNCPYCAEEIKDTAIACRYCNRDFFVIQPLMEKLKDAKKRVNQLEKMLRAAGIDPASGRGPIAAPAQPGEAPIAAVTATTMAVIDDQVPTLPAWLAIVMTIVLLAAAHFLIIIQFDLPLIYLRVVSIAVPLVIGFLYRKALDRWLFWDLGTGLGIAIVAILLMSAVVAYVDRVPLLPQDRQGWIEYLQYAASIGFGFFTGCAMRHGVMVARDPSPKVSFLLELVARFIAKKMNKAGNDEESGPKDEIDATIKKFESLLSGLIAAGSVAVSVYTGISGILGK